MVGRFLRPFRKLGQRVDSADIAMHASGLQGAAGQVMVCLRIFEVKNPYRVIRSVVLIIQRYHGCELWGDRYRLHQP